MSMNDHYLPEDIWNASDELVNLQRKCMKILDCALNGQLSDKDNYLHEINHSLMVLTALNNKKTKRDEHHNEEYARRMWY